MVFIGMGFECVGVIVGFFYLGRWFDTHFGWNGLGAAVAAFVGLIGWVGHLLIVARSLSSTVQDGRKDKE